VGKLHFLHSKANNYVYVKFVEILKNIFINRLHVNLLFIKYLKKGSDVFFSPTLEIFRSQLSVF